MNEPRRPADLPHNPHAKPTDSEPLEAELIFEAQLVEPSPPEPARPEPVRRPRGWRATKIAIVMFLGTCASTFFVGGCQWLPIQYMWVALNSLSFQPLRRVLVTHWDEGLLYMACVIGILFAHEMGHFVATLRYGVRASWPYFIPLPVTPFGTMGAVILMDGRQADRKQIFDIGIAGPLAGLVIAIPVMWMGIQQLDFTQPEAGHIGFYPPLAVTLAFDHLHRPPGYEAGRAVWISQMNPYFMAGWFGLLITAFNMVPVSQLDGGHVVYTVFGRKAGRWAARIVIVAVVVYVWWVGIFWNVLLMLILVFLVGVDHPPTRDDTVPLGWFRTGLGLVSLSIPILCFPPKLFILE